MHKQEKNCDLTSHHFFSCMAHLSDGFFDDIECETCRSSATLSLMIHMYSKLAPETRVAFIIVFQELLDKIGGEVFEDNVDFWTYITDESEEGK